MFGSSVDATEITERIRGGLHEALKKRRDSVTLSLWLTVPLGKYRPWDDAARKAYAHHPGVLDGDTMEVYRERSKLHQSYCKVMYKNFSRVGFMGFIFK